MKTRIVSVLFAGFTLLFACGCQSSTHHYKETQTDKGTVLIETQDKDNSLLNLLNNPLKGLINITIEGGTGGFADMGGGFGQSCQQNNCVEQRHERSELPRRNCQPQSQPQAQHSSLSGTVYHPRGNGQQQSCPSGYHIVTKVWPNGYSQEYYVPNRT